MSCSEPPPPLAPIESQKVILLELAAAALTSTILASRPIRTLSTTPRVKTDGSQVTDADGAAQNIICNLLRKVSPLIRIVGEETLQEVESGSKTINKNTWVGISPKTQRKRIQKEAKEEEILQQNIFQELCGRRSKVIETLDSVSSPANLLLVEEEVAAHRISVFIDPLDGTSAYTKGNYESVTILVGIIVDNCPVFGVIGHPFGIKTINEPHSGYECTALYGGTLVGGAFSVGGMELERSLEWKNGKAPQYHHDVDGMVAEDFDAEHSSFKRRKAIISKSRSGGVVQKCINELANRGLLNKELIHITGAGYKTMRLLLGAHGESLWFFPKPGTSLWDIAAADALLRVMGGKLSDKFGRDMDYSKEWMHAENIDGIVASCDVGLHAECIRLFQEEKWDDE